MYVLDGGLGVTVQCSPAEGGHPHIKANVEKLALPATKHPPHLLKSSQTSEDDCVVAHKTGQESLLEQVWFGQDSVVTPELCGHDGSKLGTQKLLRLDLETCWD